MPAGGPAPTGPGGENARGVRHYSLVGTRDPFSSSLFSARQQAYSGVFKTDSVYTPQMIIDGITGFNGSDAEQAQRTIRLAAMQPKAEVSIEKKDETGRVSVRVDNLALAKVDKADVFLAVTETALSTSVAHGENAGRTLQHVGVVRSLTKLVEIDAKRGAYVADLQVEVGKGWKRDKVRAVIFVQDRKTRRIAGAASCSL